MTLGIRVVLAIVGVIAFTIAARDVRRDAKPAERTHRLKRLRLALMIALLALAPVVWILDQLLDVDQVTSVLISVAAPLIACYFVVEFMLGGIAPDE